MSTASGGPHPRRSSEGGERGGRPAAVRASDAEREETVAALQRSLGEGRLELDETDTRMTAAYAARYRHELACLLEDLPEVGGTARPPGRTRRPAAVVAALALGLGLLSGVAVGGLGVLSAQAGQHPAVGGSHGLGSGQPWSHERGPRDGAPAPVSFWHPPREV
jgi:hypothetical protein